MAEQSFEAQVSAWVAKTRQRLDLVFKKSAQRVFEFAQTPVGAGGNLPVDTGYLRASARAAIGAPNSIDPTMTNPKKTPTSYNPGTISLVINSAQLGQTLYMTYTAAYAASVNYGRNGKSGRQFVGLAAQRWPVIVAQVSAELQRRATGGP
jgi:hypothetical protein